MGLLSLWLGLLGLWFGFWWALGRGWGGGDWVVLFCFIIIIFLKLGLLGLWWVFTRFCFSKFGFWVPVGFQWVVVGIVTLSYPSMFLFFLKIIE